MPRNSDELAKMADEIIAQFGNEDPPNLHGMIFAAYREGLEEGYNAMATPHYPITRYEGTTTIAGGRGLIHELSTHDHVLGLR